MAPDAEQSGPRPKHDFYLIQRLSHRSIVRPDDGFDGYFGLDYMGSAEYEFGAVGDSLRRIRDAKARIVVRSGMRLDDVDRMVWFVGPREGMDGKIVDLQRWLRDPRRRTKEPSYFTDHVAGGVPAWMSGTVAWWSLEVDVMWTLDELLADALHAAIAAKKVKV